MLADAVAQHRLRRELAAQRHVALSTKRDPVLGVGLPDQLEKPHGLDPVMFDRLKAEEKSRAQELQREGTWVGRFR